MISPRSKVSPYNDAFYASVATGSLASANVIVPLVLELVPTRSVVDIGCGIGSWLSVFAANGVNDFHGYDGPHVNSASLHIPKEHFTPVNLNLPLSISRPYDLAVSLEVAEHLDPSLADSHVDQLTQLAPVILFSAAIPGQGGTNHVNEQWPEYWAERFRHRGYRAVDAIRPQLARFSTKVEFWYAQNIVIFVKESKLTNYPRLAQWAELTRPDSLAWVHPVSYSSVKQQLAHKEFQAAHWAMEANSARRAIRRLPGLLWRAAISRCVRFISSVK